MRMNLAGLAAVILLSLAACVGEQRPVSILPPPAALAERTKLDERALIALELSYKAARTAVEAAVDADLVKPGLAAKLFRLNRQAYSVLEKARAAYDLGNAASYAGALAELAPLVNQFWLAAAEAKGARK